MKKRTIRLMVCLIIVALMLSATASALETRASTYISSYGASIGTDGNGNVTVYFNITGNMYLSKIGATKVNIYKVGSGLVRSYLYTSPAYTHIMGNNAIFHASSVSYTGVKGSSYYAVVYFYAGDSTGGDTRAYTTTTRVA